MNFIKDRKDIRQCVDLDILEKTYRTFMTRSEAIELLHHHSFTHNDIPHPKSAQGFLGMLRPFGKILYEDNFHELMQIIMVLSDDLRQESVSKEIIAPLWTICHLSRAWGLEDWGMLRSNNLITDAQIKQLSDWINCISDTVSMILEGSDNVTAFDVYNKRWTYLKE